MPTSNRDDFRARELGFLEACFVADRGSVIVLHGRRGVGKGRLAEELVRRISAQPKTAVFEGHNPVAGAKSYHPFAEIAQQAMAWADAAGLGDALIDPVYQELALVLERATSDSDQAPSLDQKLRFFDGFRRLLAGISERARLLVLVHDLERADSDTLELASYLADELFGDPALDAKNARTGALVFLLRDDLDADAAKSPRARDFLAEALESPTIQALKLEGLDLEGLKSYVQSPRVLEKLLSASRGLPQEIDALIDSLPTNVEELFLRKLSALDAVARTTLEALAISGRPAPARVLAEVGGQPAKAVAQSLAELRDARVLERRITSGELQFSFSRRSDLEVTARGIPEDRRAQLHGGWATALAKESDHHVALLAHHQLRSTEPARGVPLAIQAAEAHAVAGAFDAAVQMLEEARPHASGELLVSILGRLSELAPLTGSPRAALRYVLEWKAALPEAQRGRALLREAELGNAAGDYDRALSSLDEARRVVPESAVLERARLEAIASEASYHLGALSRATASGEAGLALLATLGADAPARSVVELLNLLGKIALAGDDHARAIALFTETRTRSEASGLARELARALVNLGYAQMRRGATRDAETHLVAGIERAKAANDLSHLAFGQMNLGVVLHQRGELGRAIECYRDCKSVFRRLGNRTQLARVLHNLANLYLTCGDVARAKSHNDEALRLARASGVERLVAIATALDGLIASELGEQERGEDRLREAMVHHRRLGAERPIESMVELAELQLQHGDTSRAESTLREVEGVLPTVGNKLLVARAKLLHGRIEHALGNPAAAKLLAEARGMIEPFDRRLLTRDAELALGRALQSAGQRETARMHYTAALELQRAVGRELPEELRACFEAARAQTSVVEALRSLDGTPARAARVERPIAARDAEVDSEPQEPATSFARKAEWAVRYGAIVGRSPKLHRVFHIIDRVAPSDGTVLIYGESGTGKELVAEAIHKSSPRAKGPFVKLNCAALVESLLLSELFGHERGSFTGAHQRKIGRFELAAGGTIFLDEIGDISPKTQVSLLRVLQEREFERVGGGRPIKVDARIIVATNKNLSQMVRDGTFREDLYYRLKGLTVELPPLRERPEDVVELADHFLAEYAAESGTMAKRLSRGAVELLLGYAWPGNIRELENVMRSVALFAESQTIDARDFDEYRELFRDGPASERSVVAAPVVAAPVVAAPVAVVEAPATVAAGSAAMRPASLPERAVKVADVRGLDRDDEDESSGPTSAVMPEGLEGELLAQIFAKGVPLPELKKRLQEQAIARALLMTKGNITRAAEVLGMRRPRLSQIINASDELKGLCQGGER